MKKLILALLILAPLYTNGQSYRQFKNSLCIVLQPDDLGLGIKYSRLFEKFGIYSSASKGRYIFDDKTPMFNIKDHYRIAIGGVAPLLTDHDDAMQYATIGLSFNGYSRYGALSISTAVPDDIKKHRKISFELGACAVHHRFVFGARFDIFNRDAVIDIGFAF